MSTWSVDTSQEQALGRRLEDLGPELADEIAKATRDAGDEHARLWKAHAKRTSGRHGALYPRTIRNRFTSGADWAQSETGSSSPAARGYEFGSRNQPPHLDSAKTYPIADQHWQKACDDALERVTESL